MCEKPSQLTYAYDLQDDIKTKINDIVTRIYGGDGAEFSAEAEAKIADIEGKEIKGLPVIVAKTQY